MDMPAWTALHSWLERRSRELSAEIRAYPTPIAACDVQLTKLIEQRTAALEELRLLSELDPERLEGPDVARLRELLNKGRYADDPAERELHAALHSALTEGLKA